MLGAAAGTISTLAFRLLGESAPKLMATIEHSLSAGPPARRASRDRMSLGVTPCKLLQGLHIGTVPGLRLGQAYGGPTMSRSYEELLAEVRRLQDAGKLPVRPTREQRIDWAYGNTKIENSAVTREMAERAVDEKLAAGK